MTLVFYWNTINFKMYKLLAISSKEIYGYGTRKDQVCNKWKKLNVVV